MTILQLKRSMDRRFDRLDRTKADKSALKRLQLATKSDTGALAKDMGALAKKMAEEMAALAEQMRHHFEETRRHFDVVAESLRDDLRIFAEAIGGQTGRLDQHETRINRIERRTFST